MGEGIKLAKLKKNLDTYTRAGLLLNDLCTQKGWSFRKLAEASKTPQTSIARTVTGKRQPQPDKVEKWCEALECDQETRVNLYHALGYATPEEAMGDE